MSEGFFLPIWPLYQLFFAGLTTDVVDTRYMCPCAQVEVGGLRPDLTCPSSQVKDRCQRILSKQLGKILNSGFAPVRCPGTVSHVPGCQPSRWHKGPYLGTLTCKARLPKNSKSLAKGCSFVLSGLWFAEQRGEHCNVVQWQSSPLAINGVFAACGSSAAEYLCSWKSELEGLLLDAI